MNKSKIKESKQYKRLIANNYYLNVPRNWAVRFDLSPVDLLIYFTIANATEELSEHFFNGSVTALCASWNISRRTVIRSIALLLKRGFIIKVDILQGDKRRVGYKDILYKKDDFESLESQLNNNAKNYNK